MLLSAVTSSNGLLSTWDTGRARVGAVGWVRVRAKVRVMVRVRVWVGLRVRVRVRAAEHLPTRGAQGGLVARNAKSRAVLDR